MVRVWFANRRQKQKKQPFTPELDSSSKNHNMDSPFFEDFEDPASDYDELSGLSQLAGSGQQTSVIVRHSGQAGQEGQEDLQHFGSL